jgi:NADPH:quinone reductase-like Zn-dependent oxidoreductase
MTNKAIVIQSAGIATIEEVSTPRLRDEYLLVKTHAVALNPTDWKHIHYIPTKGARVGCDYAGEVLEVGSK